MNINTYANNVDYYVKSDVNVYSALNELYIYFLSETTRRLDYKIYDVQNVLIYVRTVWARACGSEWHD